MMRIPKIKTNALVNENGVSITLRFLQRMSAGSDAFETLTIFSSLSYSFDSVSTSLPPSKLLESALSGSSLPKKEQQFLSFYPILMQIDTIVLELLLFS
jgi:hypothetical protein